MRLEIQSGAVRHGEPSPCLTCRHATVVQGQSLKDRIVECSQPTSDQARIPFVLSYVQARDFKPRDHYVLPDDWD